MVTLVPGVAEALAAGRVLVDETDRRLQYGHNDETPA